MSHMHLCLFVNTASERRTRVPVSTFNLFVTSLNGNKLYFTFSLPAGQLHETPSEQEPQQVLQHDRSHMTDTNKHSIISIDNTMVDKENQHVNAFTPMEPQRVSENQSVEHIGARRAQTAGPT